MKLFFVFLFLSMCLGAIAEVRICSHCGKGTRYMRFSSGNAQFCSEKCAKARLGCSICKNIPRGRYMVIMGINGEHRRFCDRCSRYKKCFSCFFPTSAYRELPDRRVQCFSCRRSVLSREEMLTLLQQVRRELAEMHNFDPRHRITLRLVSKNALQKISGSNDAMGCMKTLVTTKETRRGRRKTVTKTWQCTLYMLDGLPAVAAGKVMAHELTHDHLYHHLGAGKNPKITEGICEAVSGQWLLRQNRRGYFDAMKKNPDPVYGAGFREMYPQLERYGMRGIIKRYRSMFTPF